MPEFDANLPTTQQFAYVVITAEGEHIKVDPDELWKLVEAKRTGDWAMLRHGMVNPSFVDSITVDKKRTEALQRDLDDIKRHNEHDQLYNGGQNQKRYQGFRHLTDIFEHVQLKPPKKDEKKLLGNG